jgi:hypothetical protein
MRAPTSAITAEIYIYSIWNTHKYTRWTSYGSPTSTITAEIYIQYIERHKQTDGLAMGAPTSAIIA